MRLRIAHEKVPSAQLICFLLLRPVGSGRFPGTGRSRGEVFRLPAL